MGKKRKQSDSAEGSSSSPAEQPPIHCRLDDMPENYRRKFVLNSEILGFRDDYLALLEWIRTPCSLDGSSFKGIRNVHQADSFPLIEIDLYHGDMVLKFLISKMEVYLVAFFCDGEWLSFGTSGYEIEGTKKCDLNINYTWDDWMIVGPKPIVEAMQGMGVGIKANREARCQKFIVFFSEAARFHPIQKFICGTLSKTSKQEFNMPMENRELVDFHDERGAPLPHQLDSYNLSRCDHSVNMDAFETLPQLLQDIIKNWKKLSKYWFAYALTDGDYCRIDPRDVRKFGLKNLKSLRSILCFYAIRTSQICWKNTRKKLVSLALPTRYINEWRLRY